MNDLYRRAEIERYLKSVVGPSVHVLNQSTLAKPGKRELKGYGYGTPLNPAHSGTSTCPIARRACSGITPHSTICPNTCALSMLALSAGTKPQSPWEMQKSFDGYCGVGESPRQGGVRVTVLESDVMRKVFSAEPRYDVIIHGDRESPETAADRIVQMLQSKGLLKK